MHKDIGEYLEALKAALHGADPATIQDALSDAEEHLTLALEREEASGTQAAFSAVVAEYGSPDEVAAAYRELESRTPVSFPPPAAPRDGRPSFWKRFLGVAVDLRAYAALFYLFASLALGVLYFTIAATGLSLSLGLIVLIVGLPFLVGFLIAVRGIAVVEGRIVEALLGVRMPRRPVFVRKGLAWHRRIGVLFSDRSTWTAILYLVLMMPLGIVYFTAALVLLVFSFTFLASPLLLGVIGLPLGEIDGRCYFVPDWALPLCTIGGALLFILTLHFAKWIGGVHGRYAKAMLVRSS
jgi:hypothetical protein